MSYMTGTQNSVDPSRDPRREGMTTSNPLDGHLINLFPHFQGAQEGTQKHGGHGNGEPIHQESAFSAVTNPRPQGRPAKRHRGDSESMDSDMGGTDASHGVGNNAQGVTVVDFETTNGGRGGDDDIETLRDRITKLAEANGRLASRNADLANQHRDAHNRVKTISQAHANITASHDKRVAEKDALIADNTALVKEMDRLTTENTNLHVEGTKRDKEKDEQITQLGEQVTQRTQEVTTLKKAGEQQKRRIDVLLQDLAWYEKQRGRRR